ncbi:MAG: GGDEF domain-containing protein [Paracoccaceae bacterium]
MNEGLVRTLAEHLHISDVDIRERKELLGFSDADEAELFGLRSISHDIVDDVVDEFYVHQMAIPRIHNIIGDADTLGRLRSAMRAYILRLFDGDFGSDYVNSRLRIGKVHARIGVPPKLYVSSLHQLESILGQHLMVKAHLKAPPPSLRKVFLFDLQFVFDTYIQGLVSEVELARDELITYSESLENKVAERTEQIQRLAQTDDLTGLRNRRSLYALANKMLESAERRKSSVSLAFIDLDGFKQINDTQGHPEGDYILQRVATAIVEMVRRQDMAFRVGGDEFCILFPDTNEQSARELCDALCKEVAQRHNGKVGLSFGLSCTGPQKYLGVEELIKQADAQMYESKSRKRPYVSGRIEHRIEREAKRA